MLAAFFVAKQSDIFLGDVFSLIFLFLINSSSQEGVKKRMVGITVSLERTALWMEDAWPVYKDGKQIGKITDLAWSPRLEQNIGYVWVETEYSSPGIELEIHSIDGKLKGVTSEIPFIDAKKKTPSAKLSF